MPPSGNGSYKPWERAFMSMTHDLSNAILRDVSDCLERGVEVMGTRRGSPYKGNLPYEIYVCKDRKAGWRRREEVSRLILRLREPTLEEKLKLPIQGAPTLVCELFVHHQRLEQTVHRALFPCLLGIGFLTVKYIELVDVPEAFYPGEMPTLPSACTVSR